MFACMFHVCLDCFTFREGKWNIIYKHTGTENSSCYSALIFKNTTHERVKKYQTLESEAISTQYSSLYQSSSASKTV